MTDSGFSSAASNRSSSSIVRPAILNPFDGSKSEIEQSASGSRHGGIPKPAYLQTSSGRPVIPNRMLYGRNHGGYSPGLYSPKEMSPMSSLAFDFRDLNTSQDASDTPRKRLSLSSVSSVDSPHIGSHLCPTALSFATSCNSPSQIEDGKQLRSSHSRWTTSSRKQMFRPFYSRASHMFRPVSPQLDSVTERLPDLQETLTASLENQEGCFTDLPTPIEQSDSHFEPALQERKENSSLFSDGKSSSFRRFKSVPNARFRLYGMGNGKENSPVLSSRKPLSKRLYNCEVTSPLAVPSSPSASPAFSAAPLLRHASMITSPMMTSSPMACNFASSSSSAFSAVDHKQLHEEAERRLRDSTGSSAGGSTPEKSAVPGSIAALTSRRSRDVRPASAIPFGRTKSSPCCGTSLSPIPIRANKRSLDATTGTTDASSKRAKCSGASFSEARSSRRRMAFSSKQRKTKSADAAFMHSSPIASLKQFRPISAPAQLLEFDDNSPLTHSRLCSTNDSDSDDDMMVVSSEHERSDADEKLLEEMLTENVRVQKIGGLAKIDSPQAPSGLDGLISAPLLLSNKGNTSVNDSVVSRMPKPRELFRSPSAPPVVPSRRALHALKRFQERIDESSTPCGIRRPTSTGADDSMSALLGSSASPASKNNEEHNVSLNRSRSANELDIMRAVDLGSTDPNLVGDFSRVCSLETVPGKHQDLKYISPKTLIDLVNNKFDVGKYEVIDCRYPYEYQGGHVKGANSIWEEEHLHKRFFSSSNPMWAENNGDKYKTPILIFYCEFSSERGPRMARAIRSKDREVNRYPHLHYPEIYVLKDGYKNFFHTNGTEEYCDPQTYRPMLHDDFARELRMCRIKSKTWAGEKTKCGLYNRLKRL